MVRILSTGEIVPDDDPRGGSHDQRQPTQRFQQHVNRDDSEMMQQRAASVSVFDSFNQRLTEAGLPAWNLGPYRVEPIVSVGFIVVFLLMGFRGIIFGLLLFLIVKWSSSETQTQGGAFQNFMAQGQNFFQGGQRQRQPASGQQAERRPPRSDGRPDASNRRHWKSAGQGQRLGSC